MKPLQIGITGGIGSGKSIVCQALKVLGIPVYNADEASKMLLETNPDVIHSVTELLGNDAYHPDGKANRGYIAGIIFSNPDKLQGLNSILHPAVQRDYRNWVMTKTSSTIVVKEAAIMFESGSHKDMDTVIVITAPDELRISRVMKRDGKSREDVQKIMTQQLSQDEVVKRSDFVIVNDNEHLVIPQILKIIGDIKTNSN